MIRQSFTRINHIYWNESDEAPVPHNENFRQTNPALNQRQASKNAGGLVLGQRRIAS
jgi:hypothetical protein